MSDLINKSLPVVVGKNFILDSGYPVNYFKDVISSHKSYINTVKFGWGIAIVDTNIQSKIDFLR